MSSGAPDPSRPREVEEVREVVRRFVPRWFDGPLDEECPLGATGAGLDSVAIVELLVECERAFGFRFPDSLLDTPPLTIRRLAAHVSTVRGAGDAP